MNKHIEKLYEFDTDEPCIVFFNELRNKINEIIDNMDDMSMNQGNIRGPEPLPICQITREQVPIYQRSDAEEIVDDIIKKQQEKVANYLHKTRPYSEQSNLSALKFFCHTNAKEHGFSDASTLEDIALMHSELSEALEAFREKKLVTYIEDGKPCGLPSELADVIIRILHYCGKHNIDIARSSIEDEIQRNKTL